MIPRPTPPPNKYLSSWKEIAQYFSRGVRTVQRWEADLGMPVRRPHGGSRTAVMAIREELDSWMSSRPFRDNSVSGGANRIDEYVHSSLVNIVIVEDGIDNAQQEPGLMKKLGPRLKLDIVRNLESALVLLKDIDNGNRPAPDLIILEQSLFATITNRIFRSCQANSPLRKIQILVRPSIFAHKRMLVA